MSICAYSSPFKNRWKEKFRDKATTFFKPHRQKKKKGK